MTDWKRKLLAFLHDPPSKALDVALHFEQSKAAMKRAGFSEEEVGGYTKAADHTAAAADRIPFPDHQPSGMRCHFDGVRNAFCHPLGPPETDQGPLRRPFKGEFKSVEQAIEGEGSVQPDLGDFGDLPDDLDNPNGERWRARFFAHWRLWQDHAIDKDYRFAFLPADTRLPDHTIWTHMQVTSAFSACAVSGQSDSGLRPAFLKVQIGPVQDFIAQARSIRDLWSGSYLLSWLMAAGLKALSEQTGPDTVIYPNLRGQPLFDLWWRDELWDKVRMSNPESKGKTVWESMKYGKDGDDQRLLMPSLPNVLVALVPVSDASDLGRCVEGAIREEWRRIGAAVWDFCGTAEGNGDPVDLTDIQDVITKQEREARFDAQMERFLSVTWQATPWPATIEDALARAKALAPDMPVAQARGRVQAIIDMATEQMDSDHRDKRFYRDKDKTQLNNAGLAWAVLLALNAWQLDAVRQTRAFRGWAAGGWTVGTANNKDAYNGRDEAVAGGRNWHEQCEQLGGAWSTLFKKPEWIGAATLIKRLWHLAYLKNRWGLKTDSREFPMPNTHGLAGHDPFRNGDEEDVDEVPPSEKYFAVLALDGDKIGRWISGEKTPRFATQLADYQDGSKKQRFGSKAYFEDARFGCFLVEHRPLSPSYHLQFSAALSNFALHCARPIVECFDGRLIYAGGDDVLAVLPADTAIGCARALRMAFRGDEGLKKFLLDAAKALKAANERNRRCVSHCQCLAAKDALLAGGGGFLERLDCADDQGRPRVDLVPGPAADCSAGIAVAHFKAPLQDVVRAARAAEKRAKNELERSAVAITLMKRSGEQIEWGCRWASGGLELYRAIGDAMVSAALSSKFPHRVVELIEPYRLSRSALYTASPAAGFNALETLGRDFALALDRQTSLRGQEKEQLGGKLLEALNRYLGNLHRESSSAKADGQIRELIGLCQTVAFTHRTGYGETAPPPRPEVLPASAATPHQP